MSREPSELYKDKIEVSLDGRQIFYLFFGGAVIVGLVFVLGVMVGRRVEARGHVERAQTQAAVDPLAALDQVEGGAKGGLSFQGALRGVEPPMTDVEKTIGELAAKKHGTLAGDKPHDNNAASAKPAKADKPEAKPEAKIEPKAEAKPDAKPDHAQAGKADDKAKPDAKADHAQAGKPDDKAKPDAKADAPDHAKLAKLDAPKLDADKKPKADADKPHGTPAGDHKDSDKADKKDGPKPESKPKFTLQLSSFQDKGEAEAYLSQVKSNGFGAYLTEADVDGKTYYRIRMGNYRSLDAANDAKAELEKATKKSATVMKL